MQGFYVTFMEDLLIFFRKMLQFSSQIVLNYIFETNVFEFYERWPMVIALNNIENH